MSERLQCEFSLIRYVPDVVKGEYANIGVLVRESGRHGNAAVRFTRDWSRVRCLHPEADVDLLESLESEIASQLEREADCSLRRRHGAVASVAAARQQPQPRSSSACGAVHYDETDSLAAQRRMEIA